METITQKERGGRGEIPIGWETGMRRRDRVIRRRSREIPTPLPPRPPSLPIRMVGERGWAWNLLEHCSDMTAHPLAPMTEMERLARLPL